MTTTIQELAANRADAAERYRAMLTQLVESEMLPDEAEAIYTAAGKTFEDLQRDAAKLRERKRAAESLARAEQIDAEIRELDAEEQRLRTAYDALLAKQAAERETAGAPLRGLNAETRKRAMRSQATGLRRGARDDLERSADPRIDDQIKSAQSRIEGLRRAHDEARNIANGLIVGYARNGNAIRADEAYYQKKIQAAKHKLANAANNNQRSDAERELENAREGLAEVQQADADSFAYSNQQAALQGEISELQRRKMDWRNFSLDD